MELVIYENTGTSENLQSMYGTLITPLFLDPPNTSDTAGEGNSTYVTGISNKIFMNIYLKPIARSSKHYS